MNNQDLIGKPVIVHTQVGSGWFCTFFGIVLSKNDSFVLGEIYRGKISVVKSNGYFGQDFSIEILHNIDHYDNRNSAEYWIYPTEWKKCIEELKESWDTENYNMFIGCLEYLGIEYDTK